MKMECDAIKEWLQKPGNSPARLAGLLGYSTSMTVNQWLIRGRVSKWRVAEVMNLIQPELDYEDPVGERPSKIKSHKQRRTANARQTA